MHSAEEKYNSAYEAELRKIVSNKNGGTTISDLDIENLDSLLTPDEINDLENEILKQIPNEYANFENTKRNFSEHENRANSAKAAIQALAIIDAENHFLKTAPPEQIRNWANEIPCLVTVYGPGETAHIPNSVITHRLPPSQKPKDVEHVSAPPSRSPQSIGGTTASVDPNNRRNTPTISPAGEAQPL